MGIFLNCWQPGRTAKESRSVHCGNLGLELADRLTVFAALHRHPGESAGGSGVSFSCEHSRLPERALDREIATRLPLLPVLRQKRVSPYRSVSSAQ